MPELGLLINLDPIRLTTLQITIWTVLHFFKSKFTPVYVLLALKDFILWESPLQANTRLTDDSVDLLDIMAAPGLVKEDLNVFVWLSYFDLKINHYFLFLIKQ